MNTERWRFAAEMIGIAAVVASLLAVVIELRQTQKAVVAATYQTRALDAIALNTSLQDSEYIAPLLVNTDLRDPDAVAALGDVDRMRLRTFFMGRRVDADNEYYQYQQGFLDEEYFEHIMKPLVKRTAPLWRALGITEPRPSFHEFVEAMLAEETE